MRTILISIVVILISLFYIVTPSYPQINEKQSVPQIKKFVNYIVNYNKEYYGKMAKISKEKPIEYIEASKDFSKEYKLCKDNKECIISTYNDYMDDWVHFLLKKESRQEYMKKQFGTKVGSAINTTFPFLF